MGKQLRIAIIIEVVVLVAAVVFSVVCFRTDIIHGHRSTIILLVALWVLVAAVLLLVLWTRSLVREEMVRRFYLSDKWLYNHEIGYAPLHQIVPDGDAYEFVTHAAVSLANMSYGFEVADSPEDFKAEYLISSSRFHFHHTEDEGVVIDDWEGSLSHVDSVDADGNLKTSVLGEYKNANELARLLEAAGAF